MARHTQPVAGGGTSVPVFLTTEYVLARHTLAQHKRDRRLGSHVLRKPLKKSFNVLVCFPMRSSINKQRLDSDVRPSPSPPALKLGMGNALGGEKDGAGGLGCITVGFTRSVSLLARAQSLLACKSRFQRMLPILPDSPG